MNNPTTRLPDKLWQLLKLSINSAKEIDHPPYRLDMRTWYFRTETYCKVCMAGAVMVKLGVNDPGLKTPSLFDIDTDVKLG